MTLDDILPLHLICHGCQMDLGEMPFIQFMVHQRCPAAIPQTAIADLLQASRATISCDVAALRNAGDHHWLLS